MRQLWEVCAEAIHHTTDKDCCSCEVKYTIPFFFVYATTKEEATKTALLIVCPMADELQYEGVTVTVEYVRPVQII